MPRSSPLPSGVSQRKSPQADRGSLGTHCNTLREMVNQLLKSVLTAVGFPTDSSQLMYPQRLCENANTLRAWYTKCNRDKN